MSALSGSNAFPGGFGFAQVDRDECILENSK